MNQLLNNIDDALGLAQREVRRLRGENDELREALRQMQVMLVPKSIPVPKVWQLTPQEAVAFRHIASRETASREGMSMALYGDDPDVDAVHGRIADVLVHRLRRKLAPFGVQIFTRRLVGWSLGDRVAVVSKLIEQFRPSTSGMRANEVFDPAQVLGEYLAVMTEGQEPRDRFEILMRVLFTQCVDHESGNLGPAAQLFHEITKDYWAGLASTHFDVTGEPLSLNANWNCHS